MFFPFVGRHFSLSLYFKTFAGIYVIVGYFYWFSIFFWDTTSPFNMQTQTFFLFWQAAFNFIFDYCFCSNCVALVSEHLWLIYLCWFFLLWPPTIFSQRFQFFITFLYSLTHCFSSLSSNHWLKSIQCHFYISVRILIPMFHIYFLCIVPFCISTQNQPAFLLNSFLLLSHRVYVFLLLTENAK